MKEAKVPAEKYSSISVLLLIQGRMNLLPSLACVFLTIVLLSGCKQEAPQSSTPTYYGTYRCTDSDDGAGLHLLKLDGSGVSALELQKAFDDPTTAKKDDCGLTVTSVNSGDGRVQIVGTGQAKDEATFEAKDSNGIISHSETKVYSVSPFHFTVDWNAGKDGSADTATLTILGEDGNSRTLHFARM